jgi:hypothetical protein
VPLLGAWLICSRRAATSEARLPEEHNPRAEDQTRAARSADDHEPPAPGVRDALGSLLALADSLDELELDGVAPAFTPSGWPR